MTIYVVGYLLAGLRFVPSSQAVADGEPDDLRGAKLRILAVGLLWPAALVWLLVAIIMDLARR